MNQRNILRIALGALAVVGLTWCGSQAWSPAFASGDLDGACAYLFLGAASVALVGAAAQSQRDFAFARIAYLAMLLAVPPMAWLANESSVEYGVTVAAREGAPDTESLFMGAQVFLVVAACLILLKRLSNAANAAREGALKQPSASETE